MFYSILGEVSTKAPVPNPDAESKENPMNNRVENLTIQEDVKEGEADDDEGLSTHPYERLTILSTNPVAEIDVTKREVCVSETLLLSELKVYNIEKHVTES